MALDDIKMTASNELPKVGVAMVTLTIPAAKVQQGNLLLFATSIKVSVLVNAGFYSVETLDPENPNDTGYQRLLNKARANNLAD